MTKSSLPSKHEVMDRPSRDYSTGFGCNEIGLFNELIPEPIFKISQKSVENQSGFRCFHFDLSTIVFFNSRARHRENLMNMKKSLIVCFLLLAIFIEVQATEVKPQETAVATGVVSTAYSEPAVTIGATSSLQSKLLNKTIPLSIHLPANYDRSKKAYPVMYMLGSDYRARFAMLAATLDYMGEGQIPEMILIGVDLPEGNRILLPTRENQDTSIPDSYISFFETELMPHVDDNYRTVPFKVLYGASNSGFFSIYTLLNNPLLFNAYLASSPSLSHIPTELQQKIKSGPLKTLTENRFLHIIYSDDENLTDHVAEFTGVLAEHKPASFTYKVDELVNQGHVPAMDFTQFLLALYPDFNPHENLDTLDQVTRHFDKLSKRYGYEIQPPISVVFDLGVDAIMSKKLVVAEKIFQHALEVYPEGKESYLGMGVVHRDQGQLEKAKKMFKKALKIDPDYSLAKRLLQRLEQ